MKKNIIKVVSYLNNELFRKGTGIILSPNHVLTAEHNVHGDSNKVIWEDKEINATIEKKMMLLHC